MYSRPFLICEKPTKSKVTRFSSDDASGKGVHLNGELVEVVPCFKYQDAHVENTGLVEAEVKYKSDERV